jgi:hypothetical protein
MLWPLYPEERALGTHLTGGQMSHRFDLDVVVKRKIPYSAGNGTLAIHPTASHFTGKI